MSGRTGERFTRCFDNAAAAEGIKTPAEGAGSGRPTQSKLPECSEASGRNKGPCDVSRAFPKKKSMGGAARETNCLRCKEPTLRLGTAGSRYRVRSKLHRLSA